MKTFIKSSTIIITSYLLTYLTAILLAQKLSPAGFGDYSVAIAWSVVFTIIITMGLEKFSREIIPALVKRNRWRQYHGFINYATRSIVIAGAIFAILFIGCYQIFNLLTAFKLNHPALLTAILFLPLSGAIRFLTEVININQGFIKAITIFHLQPAALTLVFIILFLLLDNIITPIYAIIAYGLAWATCLPLAIYYLKKLAPFEIWLTPPKYNKHWLMNSLPYLISSLAVMGSIKCGLIIIEILHSNEAIVGYYAAIDTILFLQITVSILSNQFFAPKLSGAIQTENLPQINTLLRQRFRFLLSFTSIVTIATLLFGKTLLNQFGPEYLIDYWPLCLGTFLISITVLLYISSILLQYLQYQHHVARYFIVMLVANIFGVIIFSMILPPLYGTVLGITVPTIMSLGYFTLKLLYQHQIKVCAL